MSSSIWLSSREKILTIFCTDQIVYLERVLSFLESPVTDNFCSEALQYLTVTSTIQIVHLLLSLHSTLLK